MKLSSCYLFKDLTHTQLNALLKIIWEVRVPKGQFIIKEGQPAEKLFVLKQGAVELLLMVKNELENGDLEIPLALLRNPGDCTGTSALVAPHEYSLSARCFEESELQVIEYSDIKMLMLDDHELECILMKNLAQHLLNRLKETRRELKIHFKTLFKSSH
ncbi:MAG: cyclic nucleotide-binding domain-containing protein [Desulfobacterales bacterium]